MGDALKRQRKLLLLYAKLKRQRKQLLLYAKPKRPPKWWPRDARRRAQYVGVLAGGDGWVLGDGSLMTAAAVKKARQVFGYGDYGACVFKVK